jgi:hypothetical protein
MRKKRLLAAAISPAPPEAMRPAQTRLEIRQWRKAFAGENENMGFALDEFESRA